MCKSLLGCAEFWFSGESCWEGGGGINYQAGKDERERKVNACAGVVCESEGAASCVPPKVCFRAPSCVVGEPRAFCVADVAPAFPCRRRPSVLPSQHRRPELDIVRALSST